MYRLTKVHHDAFAWAWRCRNEAGNSALLTVSAKGEITTDGFVEYPHLTAIDPESSTTILRVDDSALWVHMNFLNSVIATRLIEVDVAMHDEVLQAVEAAMKVLNKLAEEAGHYRRRLHG